MNLLIAYLPSPAFPTPQAGPSTLARLVERLAARVCAWRARPAARGTVLASRQAATLVEHARAYRDNQPSYQDDLLATAAAVTHPAAVR